MLKRLEAKGFIKRIRPENNKRDLIISITEQGEHLKFKAKDVSAKLAQCVKLSSEKAEQLYYLLYKLLNGLNIKEV